MSFNKFQGFSEVKENQHAYHLHFYISVIYYSFAVHWGRKER